MFQCHHLSIYFWSTWSTLGMVVNMKVVHLHMVLDYMVIVDQVWLQKSQNQRGKEGIMLKITQMTIITCNVEFEICFDLILVSLMQMCLFIIYKSFTNNRASNGGLG